MEHFYPVIMAGGSGTRLWPYSRADRPKQLLAIGGERTLLQETALRVLPLASWDRIYLSTSKQHLQSVRAELPALPESNVVVEPEGRNTAPAVGLAATYLVRPHPEAVMAVLPSDHAIADAEGFRQALRSAYALAQQGHLVCLGVTPTYPETGYGYIKRDESLGRREGLEAFNVAQFREKPDRARAESYLASGSYYWNPGIFVWRAQAILDEIGRQLPKLAGVLDEIGQALGGPDEAHTLARAWPETPNVSVDFGVMEGARRVAVIPVEIGWLDVGSWASLYETLDADQDGNVVVGDHLGIDSRDCLIYAPERLVATIGLKDVVVVDAGDALLICPRDRAQDVRAIVEALKKAKRRKYL